MFEAKGKRSYRVLLLAVLLVFSAAGMLYGVWCYSSAQVNSDAELSIVLSEEALIAVDIVEPIGITQGERGSLGKITNNTAETVDLTIISTIAGNFIYEVLLAPGASTDLELEIPFDVLPGDYPVEGIVQARWDEGSAEIGFELMVTVLEGVENTGEGIAPAGTMLLDGFSGTSGDVPGTAGKGSSGDGDGSEDAVGTGSGSGESGGDETVTGGENSGSANGDSEGTAEPGGDAGELGSGDATETKSGTDSGGSAAGGDSSPSGDGDSSSENSSGSGTDTSGDAGDSGDSEAEE